MTATAAAPLPPPPPPPLPSTASNEERFRYHLSLELRRHGIEPTPALVETALRTHYANLAANTTAHPPASDAKSCSAASASPTALKTTPTPEFPPDKLPATSPSSASDSSGAATPPLDPEWQSYINDAGLLPEHSSALATPVHSKPPAKIKQEPASPLLLAGASEPIPFLTDMDFDSSWPLDMAPSPSPLHLDPLSTPHLEQPDFTFPTSGSAELNTRSAPPPYTLLSPSAAPTNVKLEDTPMEDLSPAPAPAPAPASTIMMTPRPSSTATAGTGAAVAPSTGADSTATTVPTVQGADPTSIDPRLVQMSLAEQIQLQLQVLQELQSQSGDHGLHAAAPSAQPSHARSPSVEFNVNCGASSSSSSKPRGARKGIPASMSALDVADRPSAEEWKALSSKEKRQLRNKISARNFRERRKEYITQLEDILAQRDATIESIKSKNSSLVTENQRLKALLEQHNIDPSSESARPASAAPRSATSVPAAAPVPVPAPVPAPAPAKGQYDVTKILELLRRTQNGPAPTRCADAPRLSRQNSSQGLEVPSLNLTSLSIPLSSGPSTPLPTSPSPRFAEPMAMVNTKKDVAYPSSPRTMGRAQSFFAGRSNGSSSSFAAPITQVHSMFAPPLPSAPFHAKSTSYSPLAELVHAFDTRLASARARASTTNSTQPSEALEEKDHVRSLAAQAAAEFLADVRAPAREDSDEDDDAPPSYAQALLAPALY